MAGTFSINANRKVLLAQGAKVGSVPASLYGDCTEETIKKVTFGFTEDFSSAQEQAEKDFKTLTKPLVTVLKSLISRFPLVGKAMADHIENLRESAIFLYTLVSQFGSAAAGEDSLADTMTELAEKFSYVYKYNVPIRKSQAKIDLDLTGIVIDFAFGKCNKFNAHDEVYAPLSALKETIFPRLKDVEAEDKNVGLAQVKGVNVPYTQQVLVTELQEMLNLATDFPSTAKVGQMITATFSNAIQGASSFIENTIFGGENQKKKVLSQIPTGDPFYYQAPHESSEGDGMGTRLLNFAGGIGDRVKSAFNAGPEQWIKNAQSLHNSILGGGYVSLSGEGSGLNTSDLIRSYMSYFDIEADGPEAATAKEKHKGDPTTNQEVLDYFLSDVDRLSNDFQSLGKKITWEKEKGTRENPKYFKASVVEMTGPEKNKKKGLESLLLDCINIEPILIGRTLSTMYNSIKAQGDTIYMGFPSKSYFSIDKLWNAIQTRTIKAGVVYKEILYKKVSINFDYSQVDSAGYPLAGQLKIEKVWNLRDPYNTISVTQTGVTEM